MRVATLLGLPRGNASDGPQGPPSRSLSYKPKKNNSTEIRGEIALSYPFIFGTFIGVVAPVGAPLCSSPSFF